MTTPLPTPRQLLTSLLNQLNTSVPVPQNVVDEPYSTPSNPLKLIPPSHRALLTTLHVLLPPGMLLQALDLLDRGLVTRLVLSSPTTAGAENQVQEQEEGRVMPPQAHIHLKVESRDRPRITTEERNVVYSVRSSQQPSRFKDHTTSRGQIYTVRLKAWNCSCAAFAFSCFPSSSSSYPPFPNPTTPYTHTQTDERDEEEGKEGEWEFGGLSGDGKEGGSVPVCKHLLACVLGERWSAVLGGYVAERSVGRGEMGGFGGE